MKKLSPDDLAVAQRTIRDIQSAVARHGATGGRRKYAKEGALTGEDYIVHPAAVAAIVEQVGGSPQMIAAAWLHDIVENTATTILEIRILFGDQVADLVEAVTDVSRREHGNRRVRKAMDRDHLAKASADAKTIKLGDVIENAGDIIAYDPSFARVWVREKAELLPVLREGNPVLWARAAAIIGTYLASA